ncbi:MAG TPA: site-2 protease family protein, partial [Gemmataceae bacterium]|nr:site-2 protease family protein [Gemmataceae bacterium]
AATTEGNPSGIWMTATGVIALLFLSVLLHELGHCFGARFVDGDAHEILMWPLGGLAYVEVPHTARANFIMVAAGPLVNLLLCVTSGLVLWYGAELRPPWIPWSWVPLNDWLYSTAGLPVVPAPWQIWLARFFYLNLILFLFNMILVGFPMDAGRLLQCALWPRMGYRQATIVAIYMGFVTALCVSVFAIVKWNDSTILLFMLALFIYVTCKQQYIVLEHGGEDSLFGYDFSQGYTSLERDQPPVRKRRRPGMWQRWLQRRAARKIQRAMEQREADEQRMDELLEKVAREGLQALSDEERRFLTRVSAKYRNR